MEVQNLVFGYIIGSIYQALGPGVTILDIPRHLSGVKLEETIPESVNDPPRIQSLITMFLAWQVNAADLSLLVLRPKRSLVGSKKWPCGPGGRTVNQLTLQA